MLKLIEVINQRTKYQLSIRLLSTTNFYCNQNDPLQRSLKNFTPIYKFPYIRTISLINRLKFYQTALTAITIPASLMLWESNVIKPELVLVTTGIGLTGCASLYTLGFLTNKFVGFVYLNEKENIVRVAYIDFWGRRRDEEIPLKDVVPFSEIPLSVMDGMYLKFSRISVTDTLKINTRLGQILDKEKFKKVFSP